MNPRSKTWLLRAVILSGALGCVYLTLVLLAPAWGKVVGFADAPPRLRVIQPANGLPQIEVRRIAFIAQHHFDSRPGLRALYWPEPAQIEEKADCWVVSYASKTPIYRFCGLSVPVKPTAPAMSLTIAKDDLSARFGNWCP